MLHTLTLHRDKPADGLKKDAHAQSEEEAPVEEGTKKLGALPAKGQILGRVFLAGHLFRSAAAEAEVRLARLTRTATRATMNPMISLSCGWSARLVTGATFVRNGTHLL